MAQVDGVNYVGSFTMNGIRYALGAVALIPIALFFERGRVSSTERRTTLLASVVGGCILFCASTLQQLGIEYTRSAGISGFITGLYTVLVPIGCLLIFRRRTGICVWIGSLCAVVGLGLLCYRTGEGLCFGVGEILLLCGTLFWTAHVMVIDAFGKRIRSLHFALGQFSVCAVLSLTTMFLLDTPTWEGILAARWPILYCGLLSVGVAYTLQIIGQRHADPTMAAIVLSTESVFSAIGGAIFGIDHVSVLGYVGCGLMFFGIVISQIPAHRFCEILGKRRKTENK